MVSDDAGAYDQLLTAFSAASARIGFASKNRDRFDSPLRRDGKLETYNSSNPKSPERLGVDGFDASDELSFGSDSGV